MTAPHPAPSDAAPPLGGGEPPWPIGGANNSKRVGWTAYFEGKARDRCPFPPARDDLRRNYQEGWDAAEASAARPQSSGEPDAPAEVGGLYACLSSVEGVYGFDDDKPVDTRHFGPTGGGYNDFSPLTWGDLRKAAATLERLSRQVEEAEAENSRWVIRMAAIREASGVGVVPMLSELPEAIRRQVEGMRGALRRQTDNMAFVLNRVDLHKWHDKFEQEMTEDRQALAAHGAGDEKK